MVKAVLKIYAPIELASAFDGIERARSLKTLFLKLIELLEELLALRLAFWLACN